MNQLVAVYGTLRAGYGNHTLLRDSPLVGTGKTIPEFIMLSAGFPVCLVPEREDDPMSCSVVVEVYDVGASSNPEQVLRNLDSLEGHPEWYERKPTPVLLEDGSTATPWMYIMPGTQEDFSEWRHIPSGDFTTARERRS